MEGIDNASFEAEEAEEDYVPDRDAKGRFRGCGNPNGRPRTKPLPSHRLPHHNRQAVTEVASMPVPIRIGGKEVDMTAYQAMMTKLMHRALEGHVPSIKLVMQHVKEASAEYALHNEVIQSLLAEIEDNKRQMEMIGRYFPKFTGTGVVNVLPDGSQIPGGWMATLEKLNDIEERERRIVEREQRLALRENPFGNQPKPEVDTGKP